MYKLNSALKLSKYDYFQLQDLNEDKPNSPNSKLTEDEIQLVDGLYYRYIVRGIEGKDYNPSLYMEYKKDRWACGKITKKHEAKRIILDHLIQVNFMGNLTNSQGAEVFLNTLSCVNSYKTVVRYAYGK